MSRTASRVAAATVLVALLAIPGRSAAQTEVQVESDIHFATHGGIPLALDVYLPPGDGPFPAVIVIPGGKWVEIDKTKHADVPAYFAQHGIAAFSIEYRSALEFPYPAAVRDVRSAVRWVRSHAAQYQVDPSELGAIGVSSGGHLAALVAAMGAGPLDQGARVSVVASWSGMMDLRPLVDSSDEVMRSAVRTFLGCSGGPSCADTARAASPIVHVDPSDPPMVLVNGSDEIVPIDQAQSMGDALAAAGVENHVLIAQGGHGAGYGGGNKILDQVIPYVQAWITGRPAPSTAPQGGSGSQGSDGKGGQAPAPTGSPVAPSGGSAPQGKDHASEVGSAPRSTRASEGGSSVGVIVVAVAMVTLLVVIGQLFVIAGLRRRMAALGTGLREDGIPPPASVEGA